MSIGKNILKFRTNRGLTQKEFSEICGFSQAALNLWENEKRKPKMEQIKKIATAFQCDASDVIEYDTKAGAKSGFNAFPGNKEIEITIENYKKYTKYFEAAFSAVKQMITNEYTIELISAETGEVLEKKDVEKRFDMLSIEHKLEMLEGVVWKFEINEKLDTINFNLREENVKLH